MRINIVIPYEHAETQTLLWAYEEETIHFRKEPEKGARCTVAFAGAELKRYLDRTLLYPEIKFFSSQPNEGFHIELAVIHTDAKAWGGFDTSFIIETIQNGIRIIGTERTGVLYGAYEVLRWQGWRWFAPGIAGECVPELRDELVLLAGMREYVPSMKEGRGFDYEYMSMESVEFCLWMARNRLNVSTFRASTAALGRKLGMAFKIGGHIFESVLHPDLVLPNGKTIWTEHPEWFGLPKSGNRTKETAQRTQFCVSQPALLDFLGAEILKWLQGRWKEADRIDVWGFDTWGQSCQCTECLKLGTSTDGILVLMSALRRCIDEAFQAGILQHQVRLVTCGYEGTATIAGPSRLVPENLLNAGDLTVFYPINRCYAHALNDSSCSINENYQKWLESWVNSPGKALPVIAGEYYNVSKFEDLPILFTQRIAEDLSAYHRLGVQGITYMHVPMINWGLRTLTQQMYAQFAWDAETEIGTFLNDYFLSWYGPYAEEMRQAYELNEEAWLYCADWRAWSAESVLSKLNVWDGGKPEQPLTSNRHLNTAAKMKENGDHSIRLMNSAMERIEQVYRLEADRQAIEHSLKAADTGEAAAVNPIEVRKLEAMGQYEKRMGEDRRTMRYGIYTMTLMSAFVAYHDAMQRGDMTEAEETWRLIEKNAELLDALYIPITYEQPGAGLISRDGLTRSQLKALYSRCKGQRLLLK
jgi:hypothetical protein